MQKPMSTYSIQYCSNRIPIAPLHNRAHWPRIHIFKDDINPISENCDIEDTPIYSRMGDSALFTIHGAVARQYEYNEKPLYKEHGPWHI